MNEADTALDRGLRPPEVTQAQVEAEASLLQATSLPAAMCGIVWHPLMGYRLIMPSFNDDGQVPDGLLALTELFTRHATDEGTESMEDLAEAFKARRA